MEINEKFHTFPFCFTCFFSQPIYIRTYIACLKLFFSLSNVNDDDYCCCCFCNYSNDNKTI